MKMPTVMGHKFSEVPRAEIQRSVFDRSYGHKTTFDAGWLVPFLLDEVLPGDTFQVKARMFARLATPLKPFMDNMYLDTFYFFVPARLVWTNWQRFNGEQDNPTDSVDFTIPQQVSPASTGYAVASLQDYMGILPGVPDLTHSALPMRCYNLIWNEWFRDQNLQLSRVVDKDDGPDTVTDYVLLPRGKRHDYFTSSLPWPQKGDSVVIPLGAYATVVSDEGIAVPPFNAGVGQPNFVGVTSGSQGNFEVATGGALNANTRVDSINATNWTTGERLEWMSAAISGAQPPTGLVADLSAATAATINELRQAFQVQKLLERDARGGTRYTEIVKAHFGVTSPDARLQRPELLGTGSIPVMVSPVAQTTASPASPTNLDAQGNLAGIGTATGASGFAKSFTEHGFILGLMSVRSDLTYSQGLERFWSRSTRYDFYWPALSHIGEQAVLKKEIACSDAATLDEVWGYQERYAEYRYKPSLITGLFRPTVAGSLDIWHLSEEFTVDADEPRLNAAFISSRPPVDRVIAVPDEPHFLFDSFIQMKCARPMPVYGVPGLIDHF